MTVARLGLGGLFLRRRKEDEARTNRLV